MSHDDVEARLALAPPVYRGWRYWLERRRARELREIYRSNYNTIRAEVTARLQKRLEDPERRHFQALDRERVKQIGARDMEIIRLQARLIRAEAQAKELEEGNRFLRAELGGQGGQFFG